MYSKFEVILCNISGLEIFGKITICHKNKLLRILGIDQRVYSNYETGRSALPSRFLSPLAELYGTSADYILGRTDTTAPYPPRTKAK